MSTPVEEITIRRLEADDSIAELTELLHRAYAALAAMGLRYVATWQDEKITAARAAKGECFVALVAGRLAGTITLYPPGVSDECPYYRRRDVATFGQFAVEPEMQSRGIGLKLIAAAEERARETGAAEIALDTSEKARHLVAFYRRHDYEVVGDADWDVTNYRSVIMAKKLG